MGARIVAFVAAVAMVVGALAYRAGLDEDQGKRGAPLRLTCATELEAVCTALAADPRVTTTIEPAGETAERIRAVAGAGDAGLDGWLVPQPWPALVEAARQRAQAPRLFDTGAPVLARSPVVVLGFKDRIAALRAACVGGQQQSLRCLGDLAPKPRVNLYQADPARETSGLAALAGQTLDYFGRDDVSSLDLQDDDPYRGWLTGLADAQSSRGRSGAVAVQELLTQGPGTYDAVVALEADVAPTLTRFPRRDQLEVTYPARVVTADVVLALRAGESRTAAVRDLVAERGPAVLADGGWRVAGRPAAAGVGRTALPKENGLPPVGLLEALQSTWKEVNR